ncbi:MAG TPA: GNAT family N-acetyltransferase [Tepidisphaeraceae bacterium]|nr:GNAT family N-acetyltransferase [Tepidisphaeraceae bacterium]
MNCKSTAVLACRDVREAVEFYIKVLGFKQQWLWEEPPTFACVGMGQAEIFLCLQPELAAKIEGHMHCFDVQDDLELLHAEHRRAGAAIVSPLENKPWGIREYTVRDCNGYHLRFMGPQTYERPASATDSLPGHIRLEVRVATIEEYVDLCASVGWARHRPSMEQALRNTLVGVVAVDTRDGGDTPVGMVRCTGDGKFYMIWDVVVRPSHQGQKIGAAMVEAALTELRRIGAPDGAFVGLFTAKPGFYERLGFRKDFAMHRSL